LDWENAKLMPFRDPPVVALLQKQHDEWATFFGRRFLSKFNGVQHQEENVVGAWTVVAFNDTGIHQTSAPAI
jgi:hypothetical protein